jgi:hypothetical protein
MRLLITQKAVTYYILLVIIRKKTHLFWLTKYIDNIHTLSTNIKSICTALETGWKVSIWWAFYARFTAREK